MGNTDQAQTELTSAEQALQGMNNPAPFAPYVEGLRGEIMLKNGQLPEATQLFQQLEPVLRRLAGPDEWTETLFSLEWVFQLAHKAGAWDLAEFTASQMAGHDKYYGGTHYALGLVAEHRGDAAAARREFSEAEKDWSHGDPDFPPIVDLHKRLSGN
jgi:hypothetical protein